MTRLLSPMVLRVIGGAVLLAALAWAYNSWAERQRETGRNEIRLQWEADRVNIAELSRLARLATARETHRLQLAADKQRNADNVQKHALELRLAESLVRLRNRPERPAVDPGAGDVPEPAGPRAAGSANPGCTGERLYRPDGEFLTRDAADADRLRIALASCRAKYKAGEDAVNRANGAGQ